MRQIINLSVLATLIVVAIALTFLIVDQSPTQIQGEGNPPMVTLDTWTLEMALFQLPDDQGEDNDDQGEDNEGEDDNGECLGFGAICLQGLGECCPGLQCEQDLTIFRSSTTNRGLQEGTCTPLN